MVLYNFFHKGVVIEMCLIVLHYTIVKFHPKWALFMYQSSTFIVNIYYIKYQLSLFGVKISIKLTQPTNFSICSKKLHAFILVLYYVELLTE